jgi:hypothetical protein
MPAHQRLDQRSLMLHRLIEANELLERHNYFEK